MKKILISAANGTIMPELIYYLKKFYYVIGIDSNNTGFADEFCDEFYRSPNGSSKKFIPFINKIGAKSDYIFLFVDEELKNVSTNFRKLKNIKDKLIISPKKTINICNDKKKFSEFFSKIANIKLPNIKKLGTHIIKPRIGRGSKNIIILNNKKIIDNFKKNKNFVTQELINGKEYTVDCLFNKRGNLIFSLARERLISQNVSIVGKVIKNKQIDEIIKIISSKLLFYGPINVQFIKKKRFFYLIEINPRLSGSIFFSIKSGFDPIKIFLQSKRDNNYKFNDKNINFEKTYVRYFKTKIY